MSYLNIIHLIILSLLLVACNKGDEHFYELQREMEMAYFGDDRLIAKISLCKFIKSFEESQTEIEDRGIYNYNVMLADSWLRLASIYESERNIIGEKMAIKKAVYYFDKSSIKYFKTINKEKKEEYIKNMLKTVEERNLPQWKRIHDRK